MNILLKGNELLDKETMHVSQTDFREVAKIADQMIDTMLKINAAGIASNQVGSNLSFFVYRVIEAKATDGISIPPTVVINPIIEFIGEEIECAYEGCLSLPGLIGFVPRRKHIKLKYTDINGNNIELQVKDYHARVIQHEMDHLMGLTYLNRLGMF